MCWATKGHDRLKQPIMPSQIEVQSTGKKSKFGLTLIHLDSDFLKEWVHARIRWPKGQPGGWHIYDAADEDYCRQLVNEARTRKPGGGYVWVPRGKAHDYLDAEALAYAAARMIGVERLNEKATPRRRRPDDGNSGGTPPASGGGNDAWSFKPVARIDNPYL